MHLSSPKAVESNGFGWTGVVSQSCSQTSSLVWEKHVEPFQLLGAVSVLHALTSSHLPPLAPTPEGAPFSVFYCGFFPAAVALALPPRADSHIISFSSGASESPRLRAIPICIYIYISLAAKNMQFSGRLRSDGAGHAV